MKINFLKPKISKLVLYESLFILILLEVGFLIRTYNFSFDNIIINLDGNRDYLLAHHIIKYKEFPLVGSFAYHTVKNSPIYLYLIATFLLVKDSILTLWFVNILIQLLIIFVVYFMARKMFGIITALFASILYCFSQASLGQAHYIWSPWLMGAFINISYLLLLIYYFKKNYSLLIGSIVFFVISVAIHFSSVFLSPLFLFIIFYTLLRAKTTFLQKLAIIFIPALVFSVVFLPNYLFYRNSNLNSVSVFSKYLSSPPDFYQNITYTVSILIHFVFNLNQNYLSVNNFILSIIVGLIYYFYSTKNKQRVKFLIAIVSLIVVQIILFSTLDIEKSSTNIYGTMHYLIPVVTPLIILFSEIINALFFKKLILSIIGVALSILILQPSSSELSEKITTLMQQNYSNLNTTNLAANAIKDQIVTIKKIEKFSNLHFFRIKVFPEENLEASFWNALESEFNERFTKLNSTNPHDYKQLNDGSYVFLICYQSISLSDTEKCRNSFLEYQSNYSFLQTIYSQQPFSIFLLKRV